MRPFSRISCLVAALVVSLLPTAAGAAPKLTILRSFAGENSDQPANPAGGLLFGPRGSFYGVTAYGGDPQYGTVFKLEKTRAGWQTAILYAFGTQANDGIRPESGIAMDSNGTIYGTTSVGGAYSGGTVYAVSPPTNPGGRWAETRLHDFGNGTDGHTPYSGVTIGPDGVLYGMTLWGGTKDIGIAFALTPPTTPGRQWTETVLHEFTGLYGSSSDGAWPTGDLLLDRAGALYGATNYGGSGRCSNGCGTVFKLAPPRVPGGRWKESVIYNFQGQPNDGWMPFSGLIADSNGVLYGTTHIGGPYNNCIGGCGTVYKLKPPKRKGDAWTETVIHKFTSDDFLAGINPIAPPTLGPDGVLFGTTQNGGSQSYYCELYCGVLFELVRKNGTWTETVLHNFLGPKADGQFPQAPLLITPDGSLYGTTLGGGANSGGTAFKWRR